MYCVGDLHGRDNLLRQMAERVEADAEPSSFDNAACHLEQTLLRLVDGGAGPLSRVCGDAHRAVGNLSQRITGVRTNERRI